MPVARNSEGSRPGTSDAAIRRMRIGAASLGVAIGSLICGCGPLESGPVPAQPARHAASTIPGCPSFRQAAHLDGSRWLLWDPWVSGSGSDSAVVDVATGDAACLRDRLHGIGWIDAIAGIRTPRGGIDLFALVNAGDKSRLLRGALDGQEWSPVREWANEDGGQRLVAQFLVRDADDVLVVERPDVEAPWELRDAVTGAWLAGPFDREPRSLSRQSAGRWLVADRERAYTWPSDALQLFTTDAAAPSGFDGVPPLPPSAVSADQVVALDDGSILGADLTGVFHWSPEHGSTVLMSGGPEAMRFPVDGDSRSAAAHLLGTLSIVEGRPFVWSLEPQQLLELAADGSPHVRAAWTTLPESSPPGLADFIRALTPRIGPAPEFRAILAHLDAVDSMPREEILALAHDALLRSYQYGGNEFLSWEQSVIAYSIAARLGAPVEIPDDARPPESVDGVLRTWRENPVEWSSQTSLARFAADHGAEMTLLAASRERAIPRLLEDESWQATSALALLRAWEAEPRFRRLLASDDVAPACGRAYYEAESGLRALEHLHGKPLDAIDPLSPAEEARLREIEIADDADEPYDWGWSHAGFLLDAHGREVPRAYQSSEERYRAHGIEGAE